MNAWRARAGSGTGGWESALTNTLSPGDRVVTFRYGQFSHLWVDMQQRLDLDVTVIDCPWGDGAHEDKLAEILKNDKDGSIKAVCVVHNETATGITSDLPKVRETMDAAGTKALLMVDGVSSIGALPFKMDEWRVDLAVTGSQKALSLPTGLAIVCASEKALACMDSAGLKRCYFDFRCVCPAPLAPSRHRCVAPVQPPDTRRTWAEDARSRAAQGPLEDVPERRRAVHADPALPLRPQGGADNA